MNNQDLYIPGDKWLYVRIYTGHKTADALLTDVLHPLSEDMIKHELADAWFFVRYADPDFHIRYRIRLKHEKSMTSFFNVLNKDLKFLIDQRLVWKVEQGTYQPEKERYGRESMSHAEECFYADTKACLAFLISNINDHDSHWLFALLSIDSILNDFKFSLSEKKDLLLSLNRSFGLEFGKDRFLAKQLSERYRKFRIKINETFNEGLQNKSTKLLANILSEHSKSARVSIHAIQNMYDNNSMEVEKEDFISSLIHMSMNRIFRNNNRLHEMVLYDLLFRYYKSSLKFGVPEVI